MDIIQRVMFCRLALMSPVIQPTAKYFPVGAKGVYSPKSSNLAQVHFPKSNLADRTFSIIDPEIHCDIAYEIAHNWNKILKIIFNQEFGSLLQFPHSFGHK